jgi:hypothetical protein
VLSLTTEISCTCAFNELQGTYPLTSLILIRSRKNITTERSSHMLKNYYSREVITNDNQRMKQTLNSVAAGIFISFSIKAD